jgi:hypothetical protein
MQRRGEPSLTFDREYERLRLDFLAEKEWTSGGKGASL